MIPGLAERLPGLRVRYAEPHRAYHGMSHVEALLRGLRDLGGAVRAPNVAELAIWYHDAVYDPAATDNEARSAELLRTEMGGDAAVAAASAIVLATAGHELPPELSAAARSDCAHVLDLDLSVLGAPEAEYDGYEHGIAAEYVPVHGVQAFRLGRAAFLRRTLARPRLFLTDRFHARLDAPARANMARALRSLDAG